MEGNDEEALTFITLQAATRNVLLYLEMDKKQRDQRKRDADTGNGDEQKGDQHEKYVEHRLSELRSFESRYKRLGKDRA